MAINRKNKTENKFEKNIDEINAQESEAQEKSDRVVKEIAGTSQGTGNTKLIHDKNGRVRKIKIKEPRKAFQVYLPETVFNKLNNVLEENGKSRNGLIEELVREYLVNK